MLVDPQEAALNAVYEACEEAGDQLAYAADRVNDPGMASRMRTIAAQHQALAGELESHIRRIGLPKKPDPEHELLRRVVTRTKAALTGDERSALLEDCIASEDRLRQLIGKAMSETLAQETRALLWRMIQVVEGTRAELAGYLGPSR